MDNTTPPSSCTSTMAIDSETFVGSHLLTINGYSKTTAALAVGETIQSDPFDVGGHSWYIKCYPCGQDEEDADWVSVFLCLDHQGHGGSHEVVKASHKFVLLDRDGEAVLSSGSRHVLAFSSDDGSWGTAKFVQRKPLELYLIIQGDDCCRIRCDVTVIKEPTAVAPSQDLHGANLGNLLLASEVGRDVTFVVAGELFTAHSCVLAARWSTVFMEEVVGTGKESAVGHCGSRHVRVEGMTPMVFKALLHFVYTDCVPDEVQAADHGDKIAIVQGLLVAADRYGMERLKIICSDMLCSYIDAATAVDTLQLAHKHGCLKLNQACVKFIRSMLDAFNLEKTN